MLGDPRGCETFRHIRRPNSRITVFFRLLGRARNCIKAVRSNSSPAGFVQGDRVLRNGETSWHPPSAMTPGNPRLRIRVCPEPTATADVGEPPPQQNVRPVRDLMPGCHEAVGSSYCPREDGRTVPKLSDVARFFALQSRQIAVSFAGCLIFCFRRLTSVAISLPINRVPRMSPGGGDELTNQFAPVAQLDRASVFGTEGWGFESLRVYSLEVN